MKAIKILCICMAALLVRVQAQSVTDGIRALENDQFKKATAIFFDMIKNNSATAETYYYLGNAYYENGNSDSAKFFYSRGITTFAQQPLNYIGLGKIMLDN